MVYGQGQSGTVTSPTTEAQGLNGYGTFEDFLDSVGYGDYSEQTKAAIQAAVDQAINGYRDQIDTTNSDTQELARQAYVAKMLGQKNLDQQMAVDGMAGGMADSQRIATETNYQNQLTALEKQRAETVKELESAITNAQLTGDMQTAQELSGYLQTLQGQWQNYVLNQQQMAQENYWNQQQMDNDNYWKQQSMNQQNQSTAHENAMNLLAVGVMPDTTTLTAAGMTAAEARSILNYYTGGVGTSTAAAAAGTTTIPRATPVRTGGSYNNGSLTTEQVAQIQKKIGVTPDGLWGANSQSAANGLSADEAWKKYGSQTTGGYSSMALSSLLAQKNAAGAQAYLDKYLDAMTDEQYATAKRLLKAYGVGG